MLRSRYRQNVDAPKLERVRGVVRAVAYLRSTGNPSDIGRMAKGVGVCAAGTVAGVAKESIIRLRAVACAFKLVITESLIRSQRCGRDVPAV